MSTLFFWFFFLWFFVRLPLMPEGVEHLTQAVLPFVPPMVRLPLMPEGVEHPSEVQDITGVNSSCDYL